MIADLIDSGTKSIEKQEERLYNEKTKGRIQWTDELDGEITLDEKCWQWKIVTYFSIIRVPFFILIIQIITTTFSKAHILSIEIVQKVVPSAPKIDSVPWNSTFSNLHCYLFLFLKFCNQFSFILSQDTEIDFIFRILLGVKRELNLKNV